MRTSCRYAVPVLLALAGALSAQQSLVLRTRPVVVRNCRIRPLEEVRVPSQVSGLLAEILVDKGSVVRKGDLLAKIDDGLAVLEVEAQRIEAENTAAIEAAVAGAEVAESELKTNERLFKENHLSREELNRFRFQLIRARQEVINQQNQLKIANARYEAAKERLERHQIRSPIDGVVKEKVRQIGESIQELEPIFEVINTGTVRVEGEINLRFASRIGVGMDVEVLPVRREAERFAFAHTGSVHAVDILPDGRRMASADIDGTIYVWDLTEGRQLHTLREHRGTIHTLTSAADEPNRLLSGGEDGMLRLWDVETGKLISEIDVRSSGAILDADFVPGSPDRVLTSHEDRRVREWDLSKNKEIRSLRGHTNYVTSLSVGPEGRRLLSAGGDQTVRIWDLKTGKEMHSYSGRSSDIHHLDISPSGERFLFNSGSMLYVREIATGARISEFDNLGRNFASVAMFCPQEGLVLVAGEDQQLQLWQQETQDRPARLARVYEGHEGRIHAVDFAPDGSFFVSACSDSRVRVWTVDPLETIERERFPSQIDFISPQAEGGSQEIAFHTEAANEDGILKPGYFATVVLYPSSVTSTRQAKRND